MGFLIELIILGLAIAAWRRTGRIAALERRLRALEEAIVPRPPGPAARPDREPGPAPPAAEPPITRTPEAPAPAAAPPPLRPLPASEPPRPPREPSRPSLPAIDWEQLVGVRGAAILGAVALGLAGLLFFRYSIEHGLFPPWSRVVIGAAIGLAAIAGSEAMLRRRYATTANALAGGASVVLYAAWWAATARYQLIPASAGYVLMVLTTVTTCVLSWRHASQEIALLGLIGGFATPVLLSTGADRPIGLFTYLLLLDVGLLALARQRGWTRLAALCLGATVLYEGAWLVFRLDAPRVGIGLGIIALFALTFGLASVVLRTRIAPEVSRALSAIGAILLPCAFVLTVVAQPDLGAPLPPTGVLLVLLVAGACWLGGVHDARWMSTSGAATATVVLLAWIASHDLTGANAWTLAATVIAAALVTHGFAERERDVTGFDSPVPAALVAALGGLVLFGLVGARPVATWPLLLVAAAVGALLVRHATLPGRPWILLVAGAGIGWLLAAWHVQIHGWSIAFRTTALLAAAVALGLVAASRADAEQRRFADHGAGTYGVLVLVALALPGSRSALWIPAGGLLLALSVLLAAARVRAGGWALAAVAAGAWAHGVWASQLWGTTDLALPGLGIAVLAVTLATAWPLLTWPAFAREPLAWRAAALAGPAWFWSIRTLFLARFGDAAIGLAPLALAAIAAGAAGAARRRWPADDPMWTSAMAWLGAAALGFVALAIPMQLEKEWITIGWALQGLAIVVLWTRVDHPGLKYAALALFVAATARLVVNPAVLAYHPRPTWRIVNWIAYTYLVPAAALVGAARLLAPLERARRRAWEPAGPGGQPLVAAVVGIAALVVVFVWINLAVADWFATGAYVSLSLRRLPARDLATSIAWAAYALALLGLGLWRTSQGLRWASLALLLVTIAKVFLHDLGRLQDLYRVASLVGLAVSLFLVSLAYQRFVFREPAAGEPAP